MSFSSHTTTTGYQLPSIHSSPPFFTKQPNPITNSTATDQWIRLILEYGRFRKLFYLRIDDCETTGNDWDEVLRNERINRRILPSYLTYLMETMVARGFAEYDPPRQTKSVLLYWQSPDEWAEALHSWVSSIGSLNKIMTFYEITEPEIESSLSGMPILLLRKATAILAKTNRAQLIAIPGGEGRAEKVQWFQLAGLLVNTVICMVPKDAQSESLWSSRKAMILCRQGPQGFQQPQQTGFQQPQQTGFPGSGFLQSQPTGFPGAGGMMQQQLGHRPAPAPPPVPPLPSQFQQQNSSMLGGQQQGGGFLTPSPAGGGPMARPLVPQMTGY
ncbi:vacuolar protein-sorting-associated, partial [Moniliophthora roreri]